ncbi:arylamine N-acetyltransferase family protein [Rhizobium lentis]|uniref:arylamine N-acetyltransferase family protein n=1 Tax=Rhizobium lentis TaxID=1138194 RepID=UPI001C82E158|nr:arylamine N-acetyltransferase [Rhizobium lentis]MBX4985538.1 arylamine N-acetyltransferase [Rhizobium lentis]MBX5003983.1 arylamine N-acetyltransferase [Rhizobium lentis]MBX5046889.1 arylamine N-acetyltransferase [Rhizobium lentis]MBX5058901.1 arylamine N-acetyltransferase [Rhizobium lentis]
MTHAPSNENAMPLTAPQLDAYLARIGVERPSRLDIDSLSHLHRAHLLSFTWEALDAFMGWPSAVSPAAAFAKMVERRRGGWCYEMNGLFGAALTTLGFHVTRLCGAVDREKLGDIAIGNHLTLRVDLDRPYLAEVGVADAIIEPVPLVTGPISQRGFDFSIMPADGSWLRFNNHERGIAKSFDFQLDHSDEAAMAATHGWLMQDPGSPFTNALAVLRHTADGYVALHNDCLRRVTANSLSEERITSAGHLGDTFETVFGLDVPLPGRVWERLQAIRRDRAA